MSNGTYYTHTSYALYYTCFMQLHMFSQSYNVHRCHSPSTNICLSFRVSNAEKEMRNQKRIQIKSCCVCCWEHWEQSWHNNDRYVCRVCSRWRSEYIRFHFILFILLRVSVPLLVFTFRFISRPLWIWRVIAFRAIARDRRCRIGVQEWQHHTSQQHQQQPTYSYLLNE